MAEIRHLIVVGQSNAAGGQTTDAEWDTVESPSTQSNANALTFDVTGTAERITNINNQYAPTFGALQYLQRTIVERTQPPTDVPTAITTHAAGGTAYAGLKKGTTTYNEAIAYVAAANTKQSALGKDYSVVSIHIDHGEAEAATGQATYLAHLNEWLSDYTADIQAITDQDKGLLAVASVIGSLSPGSGVTLAFLDAHRTNPRFIAAGAKYALPKGTAIHQTAVGHYRNGEYHAKALTYTLMRGRKWEPVHPISITRDGTVVTVVFNVPVGPLAFDIPENAPATGSNPAEAKGLLTNRGFSYSDDSSSATISNVEIIASNTIVITLSTIPTGANQRLGYAVTSAHGNLRDSDTAPSALDGRPLHNWCLPFDDPIGFVYEPLALPDDVSYAEQQSGAGTSGLEMWDGAAWEPVSLEMFDGIAWVPMTIEVL